MYKCVLYIHMGIHICIHTQAHMYPCFSAPWIPVESRIPGGQVMNSPFLFMGNLVFELNFIYAMGIASQCLPSPGRMNANPNPESLNSLYK